MCKNTNVLIFIDWLTLLANIRDRGAEPLIKLAEQGRLIMSLNWHALEEDPEHAAAIVFDRPPIGADQSPSEDALTGLNTALGLIEICRQKGRIVEQRKSPRGVWHKGRWKLAQLNRILRELELPEVRMHHSSKHYDSIALRSVVGKGPISIG